ncbi:MAG: septum formation protein Maf [bacterium]|nr:septum formation protein Maf [Candidatus Limimorpha caballi]MCQ2316116.1 Maf family nucleotide pyrophosphatase [Bacteroidales bacterium]
MLENIKKYNVVLASKSPRRQELLKGLGVDFTVLTKDVDESYPSKLPPIDVAPYLSWKKAKAFENQELPDDFMVITADTVVIAGDEILGKPKDRDDALRMLSLLSGKTHRVVTGVTIHTKETSKTFSVVSKVIFDLLDCQEIEYYVDNYRPFDKAGAYGIQEWIGYIGVSGVEGSYFNVMGLPTHKLYKVLKKF